MEVDVCLEREGLPADLAAEPLGLCGQAFALVHHQDVIFEPHGRFAFKIALKIEM